MTRRRAEEDSRWVRFIHAHDYPDSLFDSLRQIYSSLPIETHISASTEMHLHKAQDFLSHVETSTTCGSLMERVRSISFNSENSHQSGMERYEPSREFLACGFLGALTSSISTKYRSEPARTFAALSGCSTGFLTASVRSLLSTTPLVGDMGVLALHATLSRSKMYRTKTSPRDFKEEVWGCAGALAGARFAHTVCTEHDAGKLVSLSASVFSSILGSYLVRQLVSRF